MQEKLAAIPVFPRNIRNDSRFTSKYAINWTGLFGVKRNAHKCSIPKPLSCIPCHFSKYIHTLIEIIT